MSLIRLGLAGFVALLAMVSAGRAPAAPDALANKDKAAIETLIRTQADAWNNGDIETFVQGYWHSPEVTFSGSNGVSRGYDGLLARYKKAYPDKAAMGHLDFSGLEFRGLGPNDALVLGNWHLTRTTGDVGGVFSLVLERFPDGWKIIHDHTSAVAPAKGN